jgi:NADH-quinone oxidoreductase subunit G
VGDCLDPSFYAGLPARGLIGDLERAATVLVWGPDLKEELPVLYLRVRRAATALGATLVVVHPRATGLDDVAAHTIRYRPGEGADLLTRLAAGVGDLDAVREALGRGPVVAVVGRAGLTEDPGLAAAVAGFAAGLPEASVLPALRGGNLAGALDMGLAPGLLPGRVPASEAAALAEHWGAVPDTPGRQAAGILDGLEDGSIRAVVLMGADPVADHPDPDRMAAALATADLVLSLDLFVNESNREADVVLPVLGFAEVEGTVTNLEGRVQKVNRLVPGPGQARPSWEALEDLARRLGGTLGARTAADLADEITSVAPAYAAVSWDALDWGEGRDGIVAAPGSVSPSAGTAAQPAVADGLVLHTARPLYAGSAVVDHGPSLAKLVPDAAVHLHPDDAAGRGISAGTEVVLRGSAGEARLPAILDPTLAPGTVYLPAGLGVSVGSGAEVTVEVAS